MPQRTRRPRPIMDYSFTEVNHHSLPISPHHAMQFGHALQCLPQRIAYADPRYGPLLLAKLDLSDDYYRIHLSPEAALELAVVLPGVGRHKYSVGIPLFLPMGWRHSPPCFCSFTKTVADITNAALHCSNTAHLPVHPLEAPSQHHAVPKEHNFSETVLHLPTPPP